MSSERTLSREVEAVQIPHGSKVHLPAGSRVILTQTLGGSFTVVGEFGMARIDAKDADALGESAAASTVPAGGAADGPPSTEMLWAQLRQVFDPEIPVNIVDLGLVYSLELAPVEGGHRADMQMTLTAPGCGMGPVIAEDAKNKLLQVPGVIEADVKLVWEPAWNQSMISEEGKMKLGLI